MDESPRWTEPVSLTGRPSSSADGAAEIELPVEPPAPIVTFGLVALNILVFVGMFFSHVSPILPDRDSLLRFGADFAPLVTSGQWWRILTAAFVHIGVVHLAFNMWALLLVGRQAERRFGAVAYLILYLLSAIGSSLTSLAVAPDVVSAGASGAVLGTYSGVLGLMLSRRDARPAGGFQPVLTMAAILIFVNVVMPWLTQGSSALKIDVAGHIGGLATGLVVGIALGAVTRLTTAAQRLSASAAVAAAGLAIAAVTFHRLPVFDDLRTAVIALVTVEISDVKTYNASMDKVRVDQMKPTELADHLEQDLVPRWRAERQKLAPLRVPKSQQAALAVVVKHAAKRAEVWQQAGQALRSGDAGAAMNVDHGAAELAIDLRELTIDLNSPDAEAGTTDIAAELERLRRVETQSLDWLNAGLKAMRNTAVPVAQVRAFARDIDAKVLTPWHAERRILTELPVPEYQQMHAKLLGDYMSLRSEAWTHLARALVASDAAQVQQANAKQKSAEALAARFQTDRVPVLPPRTPARDR